MPTRYLLPGKAKFIAFDVLSAELPCRLLTAVAILAIRCAPHLSLRIYMVAQDRDETRLP